MSEPLNDAAERAWAGERALLMPEVRGDRGRLGGYLAEDFHEIGQSGRHWTRAEMIDSLTAAGEESGSSTSIEERRTDSLGGDLLLLTYRLTFEGRQSRRSSLWRVADQGAELVFHQGTPLP